MEDLFEDYNNLPAPVRVIIDRFNNKPIDYASCEQLVKELNAEGYTCEYGLDANPFNLQLLK